MISLSSGFTIFCTSVLLAYWIRYRTFIENDERLTSVLSSLYDAERSDSSGRPTVAVGLGSCMDVYVNYSDFFAAIQAKPPQKCEEDNEFATVSDLTSMFAFYFQRGAAAERYFVDHKTFRGFVGAIRRKLPTATWVLGGNAPVMANRFAQEGCRVLLGSDITGRMQKHLEPGVKVSGDVVDREDVHILVEYRVGDRFGQFVAPRANRFIIHSDQSNPSLSTLESFGAQLSEFNPHLVVIGGLQMMDNYPFESEAVAEERLSALSTLLSHLPSRVRVHFEMASFTQPYLMLLLASHVVPWADSIGANEQELPNLAAVLERGEVVGVADAYPRLAAMLDAARAVCRLLRRHTPERDGRRRLSRLHLHTLGFQVIFTHAVGPSRYWTSGRVAAARASLTAHRHTCNVTDHIDLQRAKLLMDDSFATTAAQMSDNARAAAGIGIGERRAPPRVFFNSSDPVRCWTEDEWEVCVAPGLVCTDVKRTSSGGDNISAAGLVSQVRLR